MNGFAITEWMRDHHRRLDPLEAVCSERQRPKQRRRNRKWMHGRADIMNEARQRQLGGPTAASNGCR
jgi:hypothetical protein